MNTEILLTAIRMDVHSLKLSCKIHGISYIGEDISSDSGASYFDEQYYNMRPCPIPYVAIKHRIIKIGNKLSLILN